MTYEFRVLLAALFVGGALASSACSKDSSKSDDGKAEAPPTTPVEPIKPTPQPTTIDASIVAAVIVDAGSPNESADAAVGGHGSGQGGGHGGGGGGKGTGGGEGSKPTSNAPTNLKVLPKSWSVDRVEREMKSWQRALGVKCKHCHSGKDYPSDANPNKNAARKMVVMTNSLNRKFFKKGKTILSCKTCHNGTAVPGN